MAISRDLVRLLMSLISCVNSIIDLMSLRIEDKKEAKRKKEEKDFNKKVDKVVITCKNGDPMIEVKAVTAGTSGAADTNQFDAITSK